MKTIYIIFGLIVCLFLYLKYDERHVTSDDYYRHTNEIVLLDKKEYNLNEKIKITYKFMKKDISDQKTKIITCDDENKEHITIKQDTRLNYVYKKIYPKNLWEDINISEKKYTNFIFPCKNNKTENNAYRILSFDLTFSKEGNNYFLTNENQKINITDIPYYIIQPSLEENIISSGEHNYCTEKFLYIKVKKDKLIIDVSSYNSC